MLYNVKDKPPFGKTLVFALQQLLAIMAATIAVPASVGYGLSSSAALFGAGVGTLVYLLLTKFKSPVFLGSSFSFIGSMLVAFVGAGSMALGYLGLIIGAAFAALVYVAIAIVVKFCGTAWIDKIMPPVVIGPTVAVIGLSLSSYAVSLMTSGNHIVDGEPTAYPTILIFCATATIFAVTIASVYGKKMVKLIPFVIGIAAGYILAAVFTIIGNATGVDGLKIIDFTPFEELFADGFKISSIIRLPDFTFLTAVKGIKEIDFSYIIILLVAYVPVAFVVFAEHLADHKNISSIIGTDLTKDPGLHRTLLGDGIGSLAGAFFGGCPNTTYGESIACVAITRNASVVSILYAALMTIIVSFFGPFVAFLETIPSCVMGGVCLTLYGFIAVSGLKMIQPLDLGDSRNLFVISVILVSGIGGLTISFGDVTLTNVAYALILGIIVNLVLSRKKNKEEEQ